MTLSFRKGATSVLAAILMAGAVISPATAQEEGRQFSAKAGETVNEAMMLANKGQNQEAVNMLQSTISAPDLNAYERSTIYQMLGQYSYELDRPIDAQENFEKAIKAGGLLSREVDNIKVVIAQLMIGNANIEKARSVSRPI